MLIEFYGALSDECKLDAAKRRAKYDGTCFLVASIICGMISIAIGIYNGKWMYAILVVTILVIITIRTYKIPTERILSLKIPARLLIKDDMIARTALGGKQDMVSRPITKIKKIIDAGDWYHIVFKFEGRGNAWVKLHHEKSTAFAVLFSWCSFRDSKRYEVRFCGHFKQKTLKTFSFLRGCTMLNLAIGGKLGGEAQYLSFSPSLMRNSSERSVYVSPNAPRE